VGVGLTLFATGRVCHPRPGPNAGATRSSSEDIVLQRVGASCVRSFGCLQLETGNLSNEYISIKSSICMSYDTFTSACTLHRQGQRTCDVAHFSRVLHLLVSLLETVTLKEVSSLVLLHGDKKSAARWSFHRVSIVALLRMSLTKPCCDKKQKVVEPLIPEPSRPCRRPLIRVKIDEAESWRHFSRRLATLRSKACVDLFRESD
jgi:hypothetical protein